LDKQLACEKVSDRAIGYGMPGYTVDGHDPLAVYEVVKEAADRARRGEGPTLIETITSRITPHSSDDDHRGYRTEEDIIDAQAKDPIGPFMEYLKALGILTEEKEKEMDDRITLLVNEATDYAENAPYADPKELYKYVYAEDAE
jgi:2-oxoisovalerate dehydrogenase E1 component alpha subunit